MAKRSTKKKSVWGLVFVGIAVFVLAAVGSYYFILSARKPSKPEEPGSATVRLQGEANRANVTVFLPEQGKDKVYLAPQTKETSGKDSIVDLAIKALLEQGSKEGKNGTVIPKGTKLLHSAKIENDTATLDLSQEFLNNFVGGSDMEALTLNAIIQTAMHANKNIKKVKILVEGKPADSLGGHYDLSIPISPDQFLIQPD